MTERYPWSPVPSVLATPGFFVPAAGGAVMGIGVAMGCGGAGAAVAAAWLIAAAAGDGAAATAAEGEGGAWIGADGAGICGGGASSWGGAICVGDGAFVTPVATLNAARAIPKGPREPGTVLVICVDFAGVDE